MLHISLKLYHKVIVVGLVVYHVTFNSILTLSNFIKYNDVTFAQGHALRAHSTHHSLWCVYPVVGGAMFDVWRQGGAAITLHEDTPPRSLHRTVLRQARSHHMTVARRAHHRQTTRHNANTTRRQPWELDLWSESVKYNTKPSHCECNCNMYIMTIS